jgi:hypothetical protein
VKLVERAGIEHRTLEIERVAGSAPEECRSVSVEQLSEPRDVRLETVHCGPGRVVTPDLVDEPLDWHDLPLAQEEHGEHGALLGAAERDALAAEPNLERAQYPELQNVPSARHLRSKARPSDFENRFERLASALQGIVEPGASVLHGSLRTLRTLRRKEFE